MQHIKYITIYKIHHNIQNTSRHMYSTSQHIRHRKVAMLIKEWQYNYHLPVVSAGEFSGTQLNFLGCKILDFIECGSLTLPWSVKCKSVSLLYETSLFIGDRKGRAQRGGGGRVREGPGAVIVHYIQLIYIYKYIYKYVNIQIYLLIINSSTINK